MKFYFATIKGIRFYFDADLTEEECCKIDEICKQITTQYSQEDEETEYRILKEAIEDTTGKTVKPVEIAHIFRINFS